MALSGRSKYVVIWPALRPVAPRATRSRSISSTLLGVSRRMKKAVATPAIPAPTTATSALVSASSGWGGPSSASCASHGDRVGWSTYALCAWICVMSAPGRSLGPGQPFTHRALDLSGDFGRLAHQRVERVAGQHDGLD